MAKRKRTTAIQPLLRPTCAALLWWCVIVRSVLTSSSPTFLKGKGKIRDPHDDEVGLTFEGNRTFYLPLDVHHRMVGLRIDEFRAQIELYSVPYELFCGGVLHGPLRNYQEIFSPLNHIDVRLFFKRDLDDYSNPNEHTLTAHAWMRAERVAEAMIRDMVYPTNDEGGSTHDAKYIQVFVLDDIKHTLPTNNLTCVLRSRATPHPRPPPLSAKTPTLVRELSAWRKSILDDDGAPSSHGDNSTKANDGDVKKGCVPLPEIIRGDADAISLIQESMVSTGEAKHRTKGAGALAGLMAMLDPILKPILEPVGSLVGGVLNAILGPLFKGSLGQQIGPGMGDMVPRLVTDELQGSLVVALINPVSETVSTSIAQSLTDSLRDYVTRGMTHRVTVDLVPKLFRTLERTVVKEATESVAASTALRLKKTLTHVLVRSLTFSVVPALVHTMSHSPLQDYYCYYCYHFGMYCSYCHYAPLQLYYATYYAGYYGPYFADVRGFAV